MLSYRVQGVLEREIKGGHAISFNSSVNACYSEFERMRMTMMANKVLANLVSQLSVL